MRRLMSTMVFFPTLLMPLGVAQTNTQSVGKGLGQTGLVGIGPAPAQFDNCNTYCHEVGTDCSSGGPCSQLARRVPL